MSAPLLLIPPAPRAGGGSVIARVMAGLSPLRSPLDPALLGAAVVEFEDSVRLRERSQVTRPVLLRGRERATARAERAMQHRFLRGRADLGVWTTERANMLFVCEGGRKTPGKGACHRASGASHATPFSSGARGPRCLDDRASKHAFRLRGREEDTGEGSVPPRERSEPCNTVFFGGARTSVSGRPSEQTCFSFAREGGRHRGRERATARAERAMQHSAGKGSRTPMSFRTDGFEPSAYTFPPPRPGPHHSATSSDGSGVVPEERRRATRRRARGSIATISCHVGWLQCPRERDRR